MKFYITNVNMVEFLFNIALYASTVSFYLLYGLRKQKKIEVKYKNLKSNIWYSFICILSLTFNDL